LIFSDETYLAINAVNGVGVSQSSALVVETTVKMLA